VKNNLTAIYLGCACLLIGGAGLAYESASDRSQPSARADATPATVGARGQQEQWPPAEGAVAFHSEMVELLSPATTERTAARPQQQPALQQQGAPQQPQPQQQAAPDPPQQAVRQIPTQQQAAPQSPPQQAAPSEQIREAAPEPKSRNSRNSRRQRDRTPAADAPPDDSTQTVGRADRGEPSGDGRDGRRVIRGRDGTRVIIERDGSRTVVDRRGRIIQERGQPSRDERGEPSRDEVDVVGRDGRRYRIDRGDRAEQEGPPPDGPRLRRIEPERPPPPEYRGPDRPIPGLFGIFGGNW
jgi:outer membrane biosynthesis protein TonB